MTTPKDFFGGAGSLSPQVQENTDKLALNMGENLLINPNFAINQRYGLGVNIPAPTNTYISDRWLCRGASLTGGTVNATSFNDSANGTYLRMTHTGATGNGYLRYVHEILGWRFSDLIGRKLAITVDTSFDNSIDITASIRFRQNTTVITEVITDAQPVSVNNDTTYFELEIPDDDYSGDTSTNNNLEIYINYGVAGLPDGSYRFNWLKLEWDEVTPYVPPIAAEEFRKCQRYYQYYGTFQLNGIYATTAAQTLAQTYLIPPMRAQAAFNFSNIDNLLNATSVSITTSAVTEGNLILAINQTASGGCRAYINDLELNAEF